jgi:hypothetical protein
MTEEQTPQRHQRFGNKVAPQTPPLCHLLRQTPDFAVFSCLYKNFVKIVFFPLAASGGSP